MRPALQWLTAIVSMFITVAAQSDDTEPGYFTSFSTVASNETISFGQHYAVLNLDLVNFLVGSLEDTTAGAQFINATSAWIEAVHSQNPPPLSIFTRIYFQNSHYPDLRQGGAFASALASLISGPPGLLENTALTELYPAFVPIPDYDVVIPKVRYYAGDGNGLGLILSSQKIDTVILSGVRTSGVILSTAYQLFDLNYKVYVITNTTIETPPNGQLVDQAIKQGVLAKLPAQVITLEQAIEGLKNSGPAIY